MKRAYKLLFLSMLANLLVVSVACRKSHYDRSEILYQLCGTKTDTIIQYSITDLGNGIVRVDASVRGTYLCLFQDANTHTVTFFVKKCLQGQVYRAAPYNDCRGASGGSAGNFWGATPIQFCAAGDSSCNGNTTTSLALASCATDTFGGYTDWEMITSISDTGAVSQFNWSPTTHATTRSGDTVQNTFLSTFSDLPSGQYIWEEPGWHPISMEQSAFNVFQVDTSTGIYTEATVSTSGSHFVWCGRSLIHI